MVNADKVKVLLAMHGSVQSQPGGDWSGLIPLPVAIGSFYWEVGPANIYIKAHGNSFFLPRLADLWSFQAGYRWNGLTGEPITDWNDDWLVVADQGGDPFIFVLTSGAVLHAYHGEGIWDAGEMFPDLNTMAACLATLGAVIVAAGDTFLKEDFSIRSEFQLLACARLEELTGSRKSAKRILGELGWG